MKKYIIPLSLAVIVMASCTVKEEQPLESDGSHMVLTGYASTNTKVSIGEKDGDVYPLLWYTGDAISIYSTDGTISGEVANLASAYSGSASGSFMTENDVIPASATDIYVLYPSTLTYTGSAITGYLYPTQNQPSANSSAGIGSRCFAFGKTSLSAGQTDGVSFTLSQKTAFIKLQIEPLSGYKDYYLTGVTFSVDNESKYIAGSLSYNLTEERLSLTEGSNSIEVSIANPSVLSEEQSVYMTAYPIDLTGETVTILVSFEKDGATASVPATIDGGKLAAGCLSVVKIGNDDAAVWYDPVDVRDFLTEDGYAYGPQNCYFVEQKENEATTYTFDVRARGAYSKVTKPVYYGLITGSSDRNNHKLCYLPDNIDTYQETPTNEVSEDCTVTVNLYSQADGDGNWATIGIYDADYNILWSFMVWKYLTGDEPGDVAYPDNVYLLDRALGSPYSNKLAEQKGTFGQPAAAFFQWGRKDPLPWDLDDHTGYSCNTGMNAEVGNIAYSIAHPNEVISDTGENDNWIKLDEEREIRLWGGDVDSRSQTESESTKTIYDPCPEGYRVINSATLGEVDTNSEAWEAPATYYGTQIEENLKEDSPFYAGGTSVMAYTLPDGTYDYWVWAGLDFCTKDNWSGSRSFNSQVYAFAYWSRNPKTTWMKIGSFCAIWIYRNSTSTTGSRKGDADSRYRACGLTVRCEKE